MKILRLEDHREIYKNEVLSKLVGNSMFNPTLGRIKSAAESVYSKEQGRLYVAKDDDDNYIGIIGVRRTDNFKVDIIHLSVEESSRGKGIAKELIKTMLDIERVEEVHVVSDQKSLKFFKRSGFKVRSVEDPITGELEYIGIYKG